MIAGKVWGETELIEANNALEFHRIETAKGGVCSKHKHEFKWNGFTVITRDEKSRTKKCTLLTQRSLLGIVVILSMILLKVIVSSFCPS